MSVCKMLLGEAYYSYQTYAVDQTFLMALCLNVYLDEKLFVVVKYSACQ